MIVEIHGVEVFGHHGVGEQERRQGQTFLVDVTLQIPEPSSDALTGTIDYRRVRDVVHAVNESGSFQLLETFTRAIASFCPRRRFLSRQPEHAVAGVEGHG